MGAEDTSIQEKQEQLRAFERLENIAYGMNGSCSMPMRDTDGSIEGFTDMALTMASDSYSSDTVGAKMVDKAIEFHKLKAGIEIEPDYFLQRTPLTPPQVPKNWKFDSRALPSKLSSVFHLIW